MTRVQFLQHHSMFFWLCVCHAELALDQLISLFQDSCREAIGEEKLRMQASKTPEMVAIH